MADYWNDNDNKNNNSSYNRYGGTQNNQNGTNENNGFDNGENNENNDYAFSVLNKNGRPKTLGWSVASMTVGILSVICCCVFPWAGCVFAVAAIALSIVSRTTLGYFDGMAIAGLILGIFGLIFGIASILMIMLIDEEFFKQFYEEFQKNMNQNGVEF